VLGSSLLLAACCAAAQAHAAGRGCHRGAGECSGDAQVAVNS
jgi:hypothetical protein